MSSSEVALASLLVLILTSMFASIAISESFDQDVGRIVKSLDHLYSKGIDVRKLVEELNKAVKLYYSGHPKEAYRIITDIEEKVRRLNQVANNVWLVKCLIKGLEAAALLSIPIATYFGLPRIYLYLWYRFRKKWLVKEVRR